MSYFAGIEGLSLCPLGMGNIHIPCYLLNRQVGADKLLTNTGAFEDITDKAD